MYIKLESIRGIAACMIILFHSPFNFFGTPIPLIHNSYLFVDLFFVLSGFVMTYAYQEKIVGGMSFRKYITLRWGRIYPLHVFMLLVWVPYIAIKYYLASLGYGNTGIFLDSNPYTFVSNLFLVQSLGLHDNLSWNSPSWSISTEFYTYILFFIVTFLFDKRKSLFIPVVIFIPLYYFLFSLETGNIVFTFEYGFFRCVAAFYLGSFAFRIKEKFPLEFFNRNVFEIGIILLMLVFITFAEDSYWYTAFSLGSFALAVIIFSQNKNGYVGNLLCSSFLRKLGLWSYSIYMTHKIIVAGMANVAQYVLGIDLTRGFGIVSIILNVAIMCLVIFISRFTYIYIEKYFRDMVKSKVVIK